MRFDVHQSRGRIGVLLVNCQSEHFDHLATRFVVPLVRPGLEFDQITRLTPVFDMAGDEWMFFPQLAASVPVKQLGDVVATLGREHDAITLALDLLLTGF